MKLNNALNLSRFALVIMCMVIFGLATAAQATPEAAETAAEAVAAQEVSGVNFNESAKYFAIAIIMACGSFAAALAVGKIGVAAMGAAAEKPELLGKAIAFVGLGEGIALFGFLVSLFLLNK